MSGRGSSSGSKGSSDKGADVKVTTFHVTKTGISHTTVSRSEFEEQVSESHAKVPTSPNANRGSGR